MSAPTSELDQLHEQMIEMARRVATRKLLDMFDRADLAMARASHAGDIHRRAAAAEVRRWILIVLEERHPAGFAAWLRSGDLSPRRHV